jgi:hypothetical protein
VHDLDTIDLTGVLVRLAPSSLRRIHAEFGELDRALKAHAEVLSRQAGLGEWGRSEPAAGSAPRVIHRRRVSDPSSLGGRYRSYSPP